MMGSEVWGKQTGAKNKYKPVWTLLYVPVYVFNSEKFQIFPNPAMALCGGC